MSRQESKEQNNVMIAGLIACRGSSCQLVTVWSNPTDPSKMPIAAHVAGLGMLVCSIQTMCRRCLTITLGDPKDSYRCTCDGTRGTTPVSAPAARPDPCERKE